MEITGFISPRTPRIRGRRSARADRAGSASPVAGSGPAAAPRGPRGDGATRPSRRAGSGGRRCGRGRRSPGPTSLWRNPDDHDDPVEPRRPRRGDLRSTLRGADRAAAPALDARGAADAALPAAVGGGADALDPAGRRSAVGRRPAHRPCGTRPRPTQFREQLGLQEMEWVAPIPPAALQPRPVVVDGAARRRPAARHGPVRARPRRTELDGRPRRHGRRRARRPPVLTWSSPPTSRLEHDSRKTEHLSRRRRWQEDPASLPAERILPADVLGQAPSAPRPGRRGARGRPSPSSRAARRASTSGGRRALAAPARSSPSVVGSNAGTWATKYCSRCSIRRPSNGNTEERRATGPSSVGDAVPRLLERLPQRGGPPRPRPAPCRRRA